MISIAKRIHVLVAAAAALLAALSFPAGAASFRTSEAERIERALKPGETRPIGPVSVWNTGREPLALGLSWEKPRAHELEDGYEPIPDPNWLSWERDFGRVGLDGMFSTKATLKAPGGRGLRGRRFQAQWGVEALTPGGSRLEARPKLLLRFAGKKKSFEEHRRGREPRSGIAFSVSGGPLRVEPVALGRRLELGRDGAAALRIANSGAAPLTLHLEVEEDLPEPPPAGYTRVPDPEFLQLSRELVWVKPGKDAELRVFVKVPAQMRYLGRRWAFSILVRALESGAPDAQAQRVWVLVGVEEPTLLNSP